MSALHDSVLEFRSSLEDKNIVMFRTVGQGSGCGRTAVDEAERADGSVLCGPRDGHVLTTVAAKEYWLAKVVKS